mgnify:FL=1
MVGKGRIEYLEIGTYIYRLFFDALEKENSIVFDDGLREGVAINYALSKKWSSVKKGVLHFVLELH